jgi:hypothetical protein
LKAKARNDRWREEVTLLLSEMEWTERFFQYMRQTWENLQSKDPIKGSSSGEKSGEEGEVAGGDIYGRSLAAFAATQAKMWRDMEVRANEAFSAARVSHGMNLS